ncbi:MAG: CapA family protein [Anaerolineales bacterium]|nr:CapA family protein [Anaerolineales bacterium]
MKQRLGVGLWLVIAVVVASACAPTTWFLPPTPTIDLPAALTALAPSPEVVWPTMPISNVQETVVTPAPEETQPNALYKLWVAPYLPDEIMQGVVVPAAIERVSDPGRADLLLDTGSQGQQVSALVYALAAPFPTLTDEINSEKLIQAWQGQVEGYLATGNLYLTERTRTVFSRFWGEPKGSFVRVVAEDQLVSAVWANAPAWALVPFEELTPKLKVIAVDGQSPIWKDFDPTNYRLSVPVSLNGEPAELVDQLASALAEELPSILNRDAGKLTTVVLTGVTALVRATAYQMEDKGVLHPSGEIGPMLREADILHISNEVPFAESCPPPEPVNDRLVFCSADKYMELLEDIGTDVVELTGDHFNDWGTEATLHTFDLYDAEGWQYYGGGRTPEQGRLPITMEHNANKIAFIGCNGKGGSYTSSVRGLPGAVDCDFDLISSEIARLKAEGYLVIMTFQHQEVYSFRPSPEMIADFQFTADAGADIVSGSQAHQSHGLSFYSDSMVMYGLGNLFFDQLLISENTSRAIIARHTIYDSRHLSTEIIAIYFEDFSKPLYLLGEERDRFLRQIYSASDWGNLGIPAGYTP